MWVFSWFLWGAYGRYFVDVDRNRGDSRRLEVTRLPFSSSSGCSDINGIPRAFEEFLETLDFVINS